MIIEVDCFGQGFEDVEPGQHHQRSHDRRGRRSQPVRLSFADRLVPSQRRRVQRADDSLIVSSRENFLICIDYETGAIKWILGDPTKKWYQFPSLRKFALTLAPGSLPPIGQHAPSITYDQNLLIFDNGQNSGFQVPQGEERSYSSPRKYKLDLNAKTATEVWNFELAQSVWCPYLR